MSNHKYSLYELVGGEPIFRALIDRFYEKLEADEVLRPLFPEDMEPGKRHEYLFLVQFFGGPAHYADERGHPRLRMRHNPFRIDLEARNRWLNHMLAAIDEVGIEDPMRGVMRDYFERSSAFMINVDNPIIGDGEQ